MYNEKGGKVLERTATVGSPAASRANTSCSAHVVHEPQSASATTAQLHSAAISSYSTLGAGRAKVGLQ